MFEKVYFVKNGPNFYRLATIKFQNMLKNPFENFTFRQKSDGFFISPNVRLYNLYCPSAYEKYFKENNERHIFFV